jgi:hypothetical protein
VIEVGAWVALGSGVVDAGVGVVDGAKLSG